ncbi:MAG: hypothetical protein GX851_06715 [Clostridiales bacterium]|nr:hypothetical protein [Clostridiales bacterium]
MKARTSPTAIKATEASEQTTVNGYADAIEAAISALVKKTDNNTPPHRMMKTPTRISAMA